MNTYRDEDVDALVEATENYLPKEVHIFHTRECRLRDAVYEVKAGRDADRVDGDWMVPHSRLEAMDVEMSQLRNQIKNSERHFDELDAKIASLTAELAASKADNERLVSDAKEKSAIHIATLHDQAQEKIYYARVNAQLQKDNERLTRERAQFRAVVEDLAEFDREGMMRHLVPKTSLPLQALQQRARDIINRAASIAGGKETK